MFYLALLSLVVAIVWTSFIVVRSDVSASQTGPLVGDNSVIPIWILAAVLIAAWAFS